MASELQLWVIGGACFVLLLCARELGSLLRRWHDARRAEEHTSEEEFSMTSVLGLLALLIGFTFSLALQRYETRRELVILEANAIGTTWLRMDLLEAAQRDPLRALLRRYVEARVGVGMARTADEQAAANRRSDLLQQRLWDATIAALAPARNTATSVLVLATLNDAIDQAGARKAAREASVPARLLRVLLVYGLVAAGMIGYQRSHFRAASTMILLLFTLAGTLILDLDRPATGGITVPQQPMLDLQRSIRPPPAAPAIAPAPG